MRRRRRPFALVHIFVCFFIDKSKLEVIRKIARKEMINERR